MWLLSILTVNQFENCDTEYTTKISERRWRKAELLFAPQSVGNMDISFPEHKLCSISYDWL